MAMYKCVVFGALFSIASGIYLNETNKKDAANVAIWTDEGVWGPLLEEWTITNHRYLIKIYREQMCY